MSKFLRRLCSFGVELIVLAWFVYFANASAQVSSSPATDPTGPVPSFTVPDPTTVEPDPMPKDSLLQAYPGITDEERQVAGKNPLSPKIIGPQGIKGLSPFGIPPITSIGYCSSPNQYFRGFKRDSGGQVIGPDITYFCDVPVQTVSDAVNQVLSGFADKLSADRKTELLAITSQANQQATATNIALKAQAKDIIDLQAQNANLQTEVESTQNQVASANDNLTAEAANIIALKKQVAALMSANKQLAVRIASLTPKPTPSSKN